MSDEHDCWMCGAPGAIVWVKDETGRWPEGRWFHPRCFLRLYQALDEVQ